MSRWPTDARERLRQAALALFAEQGFAATTVPEITARAGLTTRTFFRHFADKRAVLFVDDDEVTSMVAVLMAETPAEVEPMTLIREGLRTLAETRFEGRRSELRERRTLVNSDESLRERDLRKRATIAESVRAGLAARGLAPARAALLGEVSAGVLSLSIEEWLDSSDNRTLDAIIHDMFETLRDELG
ncbi:TetR/AcrR family transcriptional regulator [Catenuloplanes japonicus]|uniref:TetR/AcrR family transcriptional regulator n=1 Tax=Catenuloplanes japonicus TaxID=33876 RepID=UPI000527A012|nr:TetR/AcrR family transcriptional regulator [Catenuloplanes japonicus]